MTTPMTDNSPILSYSYGGHLALDQATIGLSKIVLFSGQSVNKRRQLVDMCRFSVSEKRISSELSQFSASKQSILVKFLRWTTGI